MDPIHVVLNPNAAGGRGGRIRPRLEEGLRGRGLPFHLHVTTGPGHARELVAGLARGGATGALLVVGGDGTVHEVANGLLASGKGDGLPLALLPMGTGNDFHRMIRCGRSLEEVLELFRSGEPRPFDVGYARWEGGEAHFVNLLGVGVDVEVLRRRGQFRRLSGLPQYLAALVTALLRFRPVEVEVRVEGGDGREEAFRTPVLLTAVTVGPTVGGGFRLSPEARPDDGLLDLFLVEPLGLLEVLRYLPRVLRGTHGREPSIHLRTLRRGRIVSLDQQPFAFELDGELIPMETPWLELELRPAALTVLDIPSSGMPTQVRSGSSDREAAP